jgi:ATP-dependent helicase/nuclease subunit A
MRVLYVALTRAKEQLIITGVSKDIEKELKEKEELLDLYNEEKINKNILKKYKSYLDWIELVYLKNKDNNIFSLNTINKEDVVGDKELTLRQE